MKILSIKFKNINVLRGEWEIDFDRPPLADAGLFAVVGPNGAGKTSILDAITLALYGETSRLRNPEAEVMNRKANDARAEVVFSVGGKLYRSEWSQQRTDGALKDPEMRLFSLNGEETMLDERVTRVRVQVAELTGLDFKRFCRSILLAQGEFSAFLNALESERAEVLEKIMGKEVVADLEEAIRGRADAANKKLLRLKEAAAQISLMDEAGLRAVQESLDRLQKEAEEMERLLGDLKAREEWHERIEALSASDFDAGQALAEAQTRYIEAQSEFDRTERARKALPFEEDLAAFDGLSAEKETASEELNRTGADIQSHLERIADLEEQLRRNASDLERVRLRLEERGEEMGDVIRRDKEIAEANGQFMEAVSRYEEVERRRKEKIQQQSDIDSEIAETGTNRKELEQWIEDNESNSRIEADIPAMEGGLTRLAELRRKMDEHHTWESAADNALRRAAGNLEQADRKVEKARAKAEKHAARKDARDRRIAELLEDDTLESLTARCEEEITGLDACKGLERIAKKYRKLDGGDDVLGAMARLEGERETLVRSLAAERERLVRMEKDAPWTEIVKRLAPDRSLLNPGGPCPLCGATDHPFVENGPPDTGESDRELESQRSRVDALRKELEDVDGKIAQIRDKVETIRSLDEDWAAARAQAGVDWPLSTPDFVRDEMRSRKAEIRRIKARIRSVRWHGWIAGWWDRALLKSRERLSIEEENRNALREEHASHRKTVDNFENELKSLRDAEEEIKRDLLVLLAVYGEQLPEPGREMSLVQRLKERGESYRRRSREIEMLAERVVELENRKTTLPGEIEELQAQVDALGTEVQAIQDRLAALKTERENLFGDLDPVREQQSMQEAIASLEAESAAVGQELEALQRALEELRAALPGLEDRARKAAAAAEAAERELTEKAVSAGLESIDEIREYLEDVEELEAIERRWQDAEDILAEARLRCEETRNELEAARSEVPAGEHAQGDGESGETVDMVRTGIGEAEARRDALQNEMDAANGLLKRQRDLAAEYGGLLRAIEEQEKVCARASAEQSVLQSHDTAEVNRRLQRLMLENLLERTNRHLEMLSGRYCLRPLPEDGLGLLIEDSLQEKERRSVHTLSGGESFLVSLCLALGLSDLASRDRKIESLFLDEGFGSLDDEMLYKVIAALKGLQATGKMVGIISHIKRLAAEIPVRIQVEREGGDTSRITVTA